VLATALPHVVFWDNFAVFAFQVLVSFDWLIYSFFWRHDNVFYIHALFFY